MVLNLRLLADGMTNSEGKKIKGIYRSAYPLYATKEFFDEKGIKHVIDLRGDEEISREPAVEIVDYKQFDIVGKGDQNIVSLDIENIMVNLYGKDFVKTKAFFDVLNFIGSVDGDGFLFHCTAGKDRTGITGALLMSILGFTKQDIYDEYLTIDHRLVTALKEKMKRHVEMAGVDIDDEKLADAFTVKKSFLDLYYSGIELEYGSLENYIAEHLDEDVIQKIKDNYLE